MNEGVARAVELGSGSVEDDAPLVQDRDRVPDLERVGDMAKQLARRSLKLAAFVARNGPLDHCVRLLANRSSALKGRVKI